MSLSNDLISQFVKITNDNTRSKKETIVYGTTVEYKGSMYVNIDGSDLLTPIATTADLKSGERVVVMIKNHSAIVTGNVSSPAARSSTVNDLSNKVDNFVAGEVTADQLNAQIARIDTLYADNATINDTLTANNADIEYLKANMLTVDNLDANIVTAEQLTAVTAKIDDLDVKYAKVTSLETKVGTIGALIFGSATGDTIHTSFSNAVIAQLGDAQIKSAMIDSISASKITAGDIITNNVRVKSQNGSLLIADETIQISDDARVRVQIGKDASDDYSINVWDAAGNLMFSQGGITASAIKQAIIRNDMVSDTANISAHKLDIDSLFDEINSSSKTIKSTKVFLDEKSQTLDVVFKSLETTVTSHGESISSHGTAISTIQGQISSKIWQQDIDAATGGISTQYSTLEQSLASFKTTVGETYTKKEETTGLTTRVSTVEQTASGLTTRLTTNETATSNAAKTATNYLNFSSGGLVVGDMTASTLGKNVLIDSDSVDVRNGTTTLASFGANTIYLGKNSTTSVINLCNGSATMKVVDDKDFRIYTDKRLVMSAYQSMLMDCYRDSTHMTRIAIQSSDPDQSSVVGGVQFTIYQDAIENTVQMLGNDIILKVTDGTNTTRLTIQEDAAKMYSSGRLYLNSKTSLQIGESSSYSYALTLGNTYNKAKSINCYWNDGEVHDLISQAANGQNSFFGPADVSITDSSTLTSTTNVRGKYVRLYSHSGGGVYLGASGSTAITSDRNLKKDIFDIDEKYLDFFDRLRPITYKYNCPENNGHRDHIGFIAQEVEEALIDSGLTTEQFAGLVIERGVALNPNYDSALSEEENAANEIHYDTLYSLRYEEFISLLVKKVQSLQEQINRIHTDS